jgi:hypothetical protein
MARGKDSARDPRRSLSPAIRDAIQAQNARRAYMFGGEEALSVDTETRLSKMNPANQVRALVSLEESVTDDISSFMSRPPLGRSPHANRQATPSVGAQPPSYGMTLAEYQARSAGVRRPGGPSSVDPFSLGSVASARRSEVAAERPEAAWKRSTGEGSTTKRSASMTEAEKDFKKLSGHALMHPSTLDESSSPAIRDAAKSQSARRSRNVVEDEDE